MLSIPHLRRSQGGLDAAGWTLPTILAHALLVVIARERAHGPPRIRRDHPVALQRDIRLFTVFVVASPKMVSAKLLALMSSAPAAIPA